MKVTPLLNLPSENNVQIDFTPEPLPGSLDNYLVNQIIMVNDKYSHIYEQPMLTLRSRLNESVMIRLDDLLEALLEIGNVK